MRRQCSIFLRLAEAFREQGGGDKAFVNLWRHTGQHRGFEQTRRDGHDPHTEFRQFARCRQGQAGDAALGCAIGTLTDLAVECGNRGRIDNDTALAVFSDRLFLGHVIGGEVQDRIAADEVDFDHLAEAGKVGWAFTTDDPLTGRNTGTVDHDPGSAMGGFCRLKR